MANGVNIKMGVSGVAQFKSSINQAKQNMKTLDAQLALTEKQYKATGDSETYMQQKTEQLQAKLAEQKSVAESAQRALESMTERGVDKGSKAFQDMLRTLVQVKGDMLDTESALNGVAESSDHAGDQAEEMNSQLKRIGDGVNFQNVTDGIGKITSGLENAAKKAINMGRKLFDAMIGAGTYADDIATRASVYGVSVEELQRMDKTANLIDTSVDAIINAQKKLKKGLGSADAGVMGAFVELLGEGYDPRVKGWEEAFWDAGEALMRFGNEEEKEVYAQKMFGRSWSELIPLFEAGREEYEKTNASWRVLSEEQITNLGKMDDEYQKLQENIEQLKLSILSEFAEPMATLMATINEQIDKFSEWLESDDGQAFVDNVVNKVKTAMEWIAEPENIQKVIDAVKAIIMGWAGLKLLGGGLDMLNLINGAKGLLGKTGAKTATSGGSAVSTGGGSAVSTGGATAAAAGGGWLRRMLAAGGGIDMFAPMGALGLGLAPGAFVMNYERNQATQRKASRIAHAASLSDTDRWFLEAAAAATDLNNKNSWADTEKLLMGMSTRTEFQKNQLRNMVGLDTYSRLESFWGGATMDGFELNKLLNEVTDAYDRMAQEADANQEASDKVGDAGDKIADAAKDMSKLPQETATAVGNALNNASVVIDGAALSAIVGSLMAQYVANS